MIDCQSSSKDSKIKVEENGRKAVFQNARREKYIVTDFDGCVVKNKLAADWIVSKGSIGDLIVELKGKDVEHGARQIFATADYLQANDLRTGKLSALIVCAQFPKERTKTQRAQLAFAKRFKGLLHVKSGNHEYDFASLFTADAG